MIVIKQFTALEVKTKTVNDAKIAELQFGKDSYRTPYIETEFDTEDEAVEYAYKANKWGTWLILPVIKFNNFTEG